MNSFDSIDFSDAQVFKIEIKGNKLLIKFNDWQQTIREIEFNDVIAYEAFSIEGEELSHGVCEKTDDFLTKAINILEEDSGEFLSYSLVSAWSNKKVLTVIAKSFIFI
jgi:hypothetical protein